MALKRSFEESEDIMELPSVWVNRLTGDPNATLLLAHVAQKAGVAEKEFKKIRLTLPSSLQEKWEKVAPSFGLATNLIYPGIKLPRHSPPMCYLPPSFHKELYQAGWRLMDVYQERTYQDREAIRVKLLEPVSFGLSLFSVTTDKIQTQWFVPILAIFEGRVIDMPESAMVATSFSLGAVEHKVRNFTGVSSGTTKP